MLQDLKYVLRSLGRNPGFTTVAVLTLALGIGANVAVFTVVRGVLLKPLPFPDAHQLARVYTNFPATGLTEMSLSAGEFVDVRDRSHAFGSMGGYVPAWFNLTGGGEPERVAGAYVTEGFFARLGADALVGRTITQGDGREGTGGTVVLRHGFWQRRFGGEPGVVGRTITLNGNRLTVIGVMPSGFSYPEAADLWVAFGLTPDLLGVGERGSRFLRVLGRVPAGQTLAAAQAELNALVPLLGEEYPGFYASQSDFALSVASLQQTMVGRPTRAALWVLFGGVVVVLLIACANLANVSLIRGAHRQREFIVRSALGAPRARMMRFLLVEGGVIAVMGGLAGLLVAWWGIGGLIALMPSDLPRTNEIRVDGAVIAFATLVTMLTGLGFGLIPAPYGSRSNLVGALRSHGHSTTARATSRAQAAIVVAQLALSIALLVVSGLMVKSFAHLQRMEPGLDPSNTLTASVTLPSSTYSSDEQVMAFFEQFAETVAGLGGVEVAGASAILPFTGGGWDISFEVAGRPSSGAAPDLNTEYRPVTPGFFRALRIPRVRGRMLADADRANTPLVAVVNEAFAKRFWGAGDPVGQRVILPRLGLEVEIHEREIVGVVGDVRHALDHVARPELYVPIAQQAVRSATLLIRGASDVRGLVPALRTAVREIDSDLPVYQIRTMDEAMAASVAQRRFNAIWLSVFATAALLLASIGLYGVIGFSVTKRTREIGIRVVLGATRWNVARGILRQAGLLVGVGSLLGLTVASGLSRLLGSLLFHVAAIDVLTYASVTVLLAGVSLVAAYVPARRGARTDPMDALRCE